VDREVNPVHVDVFAVTVDALVKEAASMFATVAKAGTVIALAVETTKVSVPAPPSNLSTAVQVAAVATSLAVKVSFPAPPFQVSALVVSVKFWQF
jgi:hypothetical protein